MPQAARNVEEIFYAALELDGSEARSAFLDRVCGDTELRRRVERLLAVDAKGHDFLEAPASPPTVTVAPDARSGVEEPGTTIGPYKLLEAIGEGGMGVVYMAEQAEPVRRRVALKVIKPGMDSKQVVARFEAERQALALMDHPNIAKVHDGGMTPSGRPYFVMELVRGLPITEYCDEQQLSIAERLELFVLVCRAVQHAHQKGVIHRDLKPSNVLVTVIDGAGVPKVIDFGVAKATGGALTDKTVFTGFHQFVGTPLYVSPEQSELAGVDVDTRSDIYSLGVLLYELLTGTTPFDSETLKRAAFDEMRRIIREEEPPRPSTRLSSLGETLPTISARRKADPRRLGASLKGELDSVVMKALEKDRRRRYETANDFAADVVRYLTDQPVEACPPSVWYRCSKFAGRNRAALLTVTLIVIALIAGTTISTWQALRAMRAERESGRQSALARKAVDEMYTQFAEKMLKGHGELEAVQREFLEKALAYYQEFSRERHATPELRRETAKAASRVGDIHQLMGRYDQAIDAFLQASSLYEALSRESPDSSEFQQEIAGGLRRIGSLLTNLGKPGEAKQVVRRAIERLERRVVDHPREADSREKLAGCYTILASVLEMHGGRSDADEYNRRAIAHYAKLVDDFPRVVSYRDGLAGVEINQGNLLIGVGRSQEGEAAYQRARRLLERIVSEHPNHPAHREGLSKVLNNLATRMKDTGRSQEAENLCRRAIELDAALVAEFPERDGYRDLQAGAHINFGVLLMEMGRSQEAESHYQVARRIYEKLASDRPKVPDYRDRLAMVHFNMGVLRYKTGHPEEGGPFFRRALGMREKLVAEFPGHPEYQQWLAISYGGFAKSLWETGKLEEAERAYRRGIDVAEALVVLDPNAPSYRFRAGCEANDLAILIASRGEIEEAKRFYERGIAHERAALKINPDHPGCRGLLKKLCMNLCHLIIFDDPELAFKLARSILELDPNDELGWVTTGLVEYRRGNWQASIEVLEEHKQEVNWENYVLAMDYWQLGDAARARTLFDQAGQWLRGFETRWKPGKWPDPRNLRRLRAEASSLLGLNEPTDGGGPR